MRVRAVVCAILIFQPAQASLSYRDFEAISVLFERRLTPYTVKVAGKPTSVNRRWEENLRPIDPRGFPPAGGASYLLTEKVVGANVVGGLARHPRIGPKEYLFVLCHELAHALSASDRDANKIFEESADYFAVNYCLPGLLGGERRSNKHMPAIAINSTQYLFELFNEWRPNFYRKPDPSFRSQSGGGLSPDFFQCRLERLLFWSGNLGHQISAQCLGDPAQYELVMRKLRI